MAVTWFFTLLLLSMSGYIIYYSATHKQELINNSYNGRQQMLLAQNRRGSIYSGDGQILARTVEGEDGKKYANIHTGICFPMWSAMRLMVKWDWNPSAIII